MSDLKGDELVEYLQEKYGKIISILNIQLQDCEYFITVETEKQPTVYFSTGKGIDNYRYTCDSTDWKEHVYGGLELDNFSNTPFKKSSIYHNNDYIPAINRWIKHLNKKYGKVLSINVKAAYKYEVFGEITVENRDHPIKVNFSNCYDDYCEIDTFDVSWTGLFNGTSVDVYESDSESVENK